MPEVEREVLALDISGELAPGEVVRWVGRPHPRTAALSTAGQVLFGFFWLLVTGTGFAALLRKGELLAAALTSIFVAIGVYMLFGPMLAYRQALAAVFVITDRRLIILEKGGRVTTSILLTKIGQVRRVRKRHRVTLRIPISTVADADGLLRLRYLDLQGLVDGERAFELLTRR